jgi:ubiquinone/menaquinone biosynthesis C-methylase UbiE
VLDVGTGCGVLIRVMQQEAKVPEENVLGVDLAPAMVEQSRLRYPKAEFWVGDIVDLPQVGG